MTALVPHSLESEMAVLGSILLAPHRRQELDGVLATDDFFLPAHREIWDAMTVQPLDVVTLGEEMARRGTLSRLKEGQLYFLDLTGSVATAENAGYYAKVVREKAVLRRLIALAMETATRAGGDCDLGELLSEVRGNLDKLEVPSEVGPVRIGDALEAATDAIEQRARAPEKYAVLSGLAALDGVLGGFRAGQQIVVAANAGGGKTAFAWTTAIRAATAGIPVLVFSLEMKRQEMVERALTFVGNVGGLARGELDLNGWERVGQAAKKLKPIPLWVDDRKLSLGRIAGEARRWRSQHARDGMAMVVVDYLGLVRSDERSDNRQLEVAAMSRSFKQLAGDLDLPLILVAQLNRQNVTGGTPRKPVLSDLRDSGAIEQDADIVLFVWRDGPLSEVIVGKHRNGRVGTVPVRWQGETMGFYDDDGPDFDSRAADDPRYPS